MKSETKPHLLPLLSASIHSTPFSGTKMINDQRSIARLPLHIFTNLSSHEEGELQKSPEALRNSILKKLENAGKILKKPFPHDASINTVGELMVLSHTTLLRLLDPLLISGKLQMITCLLCEHI